MDHDERPNLFPESPNPIDSMKDHRRWPATCKTLAEVNAEPEPTRLQYLHLLYKYHGCMVHAHDGSFRVGNFTICCFLCSYRWQDSSHGKKTLLVYTFYSRLYILNGLTDTSRHWHRYLGTNVMDLWCVCPKFIASVGRSYLKR